jgi:HK97 family phage portal protein
VQCLERSQQRRTDLRQVGIAAIDRGRVRLRKLDNGGVPVVGRLELEGLVQCGAYGHDRYGTPVGYDRGVRWPWTKREQPTALTLPVTDPLVATWLSPFGPGSGPSNRLVDASSILSTSSVYRAVSLVAGTLASLPLHSLRDTGDGQSEKVTSIFDDPDGPDGQTQFEWTETLFAHLMLFGRAGALKVKNAAGGLLRLPLVHPGSFILEDPTPEEYDTPEKMPRGGVWFRVTLDDETTVKLDADDFWFVPAMSMDGQRGMGLLDIAKQSLGVVMSGDAAAARMMDSGAMIAGLATPEDDFEPEELPEVRRQLDSSVGGTNNAGKIALVNRRLKFTPWTMTAADAQFLQQRQFSIEEVSRWSGVPPHLLMQTEKQTSWGTGVEEQNRALGRTVLNPWACRLEGRGSRLLANPRRLEIDFSGLERPSPDKEIELLLKQTGGKPILTQNEARKRLNLPPVDGGDVLNAPAAAPAPGDHDDDGEGDDDVPPAE